MVMAIYKINKKSNYTTIDNNIFKNKNLSFKATGLLATMLSLPEDWDFSEIGLTKLKLDNKKAIKSALKELEEQGYLVRNRQRDEKGRLKEIVYDIYEEPKCHFQTLENQTLEKEPQLNTNIIKDLSNQKEIYKERFETFYKEYPKKVSKQKTLQWFLKHKPDEELFNKMMSSLKKQKQTQNWLKDNGQYIPFPTTWLNGERWEDEVGVENINEDRRVYF